MVESFVFCATKSPSPVKMRGVRTPKVSTIASGRRRYGGNFWSKSAKRISSLPSKPARTAPIDPTDTWRSTLRGEREWKNLVVTKSFHYPAKALPHLGSQPAAGIATNLFHLLATPYTTAPKASPNCTKSFHFRGRPVNLWQSGMVEAIGGFCAQPVGSSTPIPSTLAHTALGSGSFRQGGNDWCKCG